jgi:hypothetical protein
MHAGIGRGDHRSGGGGRRGGKGGRRRRVARCGGGLVSTAWHGASLPGGALFREIGRARFRDSAAHRPGGTPASVEVHHRLARLRASAPKVAHHRLGEARAARRLHPRLHQAGQVIGDLLVGGSDRH